MQELAVFTRTGIVLGNHVFVWLLAATVFAAVFVLAPQLRNFLIRRLSKESTNGGRVPVLVLQAIAGRTLRLFLTAIGLWLAARILTLPAGVVSWIGALLMVATALQFGVWANALVTLWIERGIMMRQGHVDRARSSAAQIIRLFALTVIWSAVLLLLLSNFGVDVTGLVAGLGVGGIAIAFALQTVLRDLFASLAIILDKPFVVGDFIIFDENMGTVERIGLKTTRIRSLWGEQISVSNDALLSTQLRNFMRMEERRITFNLHAQYGPPISVLEALPGFVRETIENMEGARFDRAHLAEFNELGVRFEVVYYVLSPDFGVYMDLNQRILLRIAAWFEEHGLRFAQPTRRLVEISPQGDTARPAPGTATGTPAHGS